MSTELINKAVVTQFITELFQNFSSEHMHALVTDDFRAHAWTSYGTTLPNGVQHLEQILTILRATFRNPRVLVEDLITQKDNVVARYLFEAEYVGDFEEITDAREKIRMTGILIARMRNQKLVEAWWEEDRLGMLRQVRAA